MMGILRAKENIPSAHLVVRSVTTSNEAGTGSRQLANQPAGWVDRVSDGGEEGALESGQQG